MRDLKPGEGAGRLKTWLPAALIALVPTAFTLVNSDWLYSPLGYLDPWVFVGLGLNYDIHGFAAGDYKSARVPWDLYEFWARHHLTPLAAQYLLHHLTHMVTGVAVYLSLGRLLGWLPAFLGSLFVVAYPDFYSSTGGADYMNSGAAALYALTFLTTTVLAERPRAGWLMVLAGALFGLTVQTDLIFALLGGTLVAHAVVLRRNARLPLEPRKLLSCGVAGIIGGTVLLGLINHHYGRRFFFSWMEITRVFGLFQNRSLEGTSFVPWATGWYLQASYLGALLAVAIAALSVAAALWFRSRPPGRDVIALSLLLQFVVLFALWSVAQALGYHALEPDYFTYALLVPMGMAIATMFARLPVFSGSPVTEWCVLLSILVAILLPLLEQPLFAPLLQVWQAPYPLAGGFVWMLGGLCAMLALVWAPRVPFIPIVGALCIGIANTAASGSLAFFRPTACTLQRDGYLTIVDINRWLRSVEPTLEHIYVWFDEKEPLTVSHCSPIPIAYIGSSLTSIGFQYLAAPFPLPAIPEISDARLAEVYRDQPLIIVVSRRPEYAVELKRRFDAMQMPVTLETRRFRSGSLDLDLAVLHFARS